MNGDTNVKRLVDAGVLDPNYAKYLDDDGVARINAIALTDHEIQILADFKQKLGLDPLELHGGAFKCMGHL